MNILLNPLWQEIIIKNVYYKHMIKFDPVIPKLKGAYIVGGSIRDLLLGRSPSDYDIVVRESPDKYACDLAMRCNGHVVKIGKQNQTIFRVISESTSFDISAIEGKTIQDDLKKRDFTINAIGYSLISGKLIDLFEGIKDLSLKTIRMVSTDIFQKDPVRLLRAYRIGAMYNFEIETETASAIAKNAKLIKTSAGERIRAELFKVFYQTKSYGYIDQMAKSGLLFEILPELTILKGCNQNEHHKYDVLDHSLAAYSHLETLLNDRDINPEIFNFLNRDMDKKRSALLKCSILLHDIGKPNSLTIGNNGKINFWGHDKISAEIAKQISTRLKLSNNEANYIDFIIRNHIAALHLYNSDIKNSLSNKSLTRFFIKCGDMTPDILLHTIADIKGKGTEDKRNESFFRFASYLLKEFFSGYKVKQTGPRLITGNDLIEEFGLSPSPLFKRILSIVEESRLANDIKNREEAFSLVKELIKYNSGE
ncbi:MAG: HD domain-containing protein [Proteobacteria bacterium]|nr:HD domain-containing protein [Pseudomonadota bacterium]